MTQNGKRTEEWRLSPTPADLANWQSAGVFIVQEEQVLVGGHRGVRLRCETGSSRVGFETPVSKQRGQVSS